MPTLEINTGRSIEKVQYTDFCLPGIYYNSDDDKAVANCKNFHIIFDNTLPLDAIQHRLSRFDGFFILSSRSENGYAQYIVLDSASPKDTETLVSELPSDPAQLIRQGASTSIKQLNEIFQKGL